MHFIDFLGCYAGLIGHSTQSTLALLALAALICLADALLHRMKKRELISRPVFVMLQCFAFVLGFLDLAELARQSLFRLLP